MKKITVTDVQEFQIRRDSRTALQELIVYGPEKMDVSDGYHTMDELYDHRITLFIALCDACTCIDLVSKSENIVSGRCDVWRSKLHSDGSEFEGWFILGMNKEKGKQITYHLPLSKWGATEFAETLDKAPEWDGHTSADVLERLAKL